MPGLTCAASGGAMPTVVWRRRCRGAAGCSPSRFRWWDATTWTTCWPPAPARSWPGSTPGRSTPRCGRSRGAAAPGGAWRGCRRRGGRRLRPPPDRGAADPRRGRATASRGGGWWRSSSRGPSPRGARRSPPPTRMRSARPTWRCWRRCSIAAGWRQGTCWTGRRLVEALGRREHGRGRARRRGRVDVRALGAAPR